MTIEYSISRQMLLRWYFRSLVRNPRHLISWAYIASIFVRVSESTRLSPSTAAIATAAVAAIFLAIYPQLRYKPQVRTLTVLEDGISSTIKGRSEAYPWSKVAKIEKHDGGLTIGFRNVSAFIVPPSAFRSGAERDELLSQCRKWWEASREKPAA
jgi:membrane protein YdbS with pleckstrin-like domain